MKKPSKKPSNQQSLVALDESIAKWKDIVSGGQSQAVVSETRCALCILGKKYDEFSCRCCVLADFTRESECDNTPYYDTSDWDAYTMRVPTKPNQADNQMLVLLYEVRNSLVVSISNENEEINHRGRK